MMPTYKKSRKENPRNHRPVSLIMVAGHAADLLESDHRVFSGQPEDQA